MLIPAYISNTTVLWIVIGSAAMWLLIAAAVAEYARDLGFPFFPIFLAALFSPPLLGPMFVLLLVTVGAGPRGPALPACGRFIREGEMHCATCGYSSARAATAPPHTIRPPSR